MRMDLSESLKEYYAADSDRERKFKDAVDGKSSFSLRDIDWFVVNMSARQPDVFVSGDGDRVVDVHHEYKEALRCYHKDLFDVFNRKTGRDDGLKQRNFFRWALENGIVERVEDRLEDIKTDISKSRKGKGARRRRAPVTVFLRKKGKIDHFH